MNLLMARLDVLKNIVSALKVSVKMLGILSFFGVSFITLFSVFSISYYAESIYPEKHPEEYCERVYDCVIALYINEQIGEDMEEFKSGRFFYDMIYVLIMGILFDNIIGGVLIDNFASLRQAREEMLMDKTEKCFICGIDKEALEKKSEDLKTHYTKQYHKLWNYVFYLYYLEKQPKKTGLEASIKDKTKEEDVSWIPVATSGENNIGDLLAQL
jgi:inositol 1,4,5-triphosphate receptor type 1/inositol 1,4,5-triphosphate receptor type 3